MKKLLIRLFVFTGFVALTVGTVAAQSNDISGQSYVIQINDSLWKLAEKYLGDGNLYPQIVQATNAKAETESGVVSIDNPNVVSPGQTIWIPGEAGLPMPAATPTPVEASTAVVAPVVASNAAAPSGHIAFSFWNNHSDRCTYEINIIDVAACLQDNEQCLANRQIFPLNNVSEPALSPDGTQLAFRSWGQPPTEDSPYINCAPAHPYRHVGSSNLDGTLFVSAATYWEDSHPDWSPDGTRLLFDSTRIGDGSTRIYVADVNGQNEQDMFIAGQHPSWANDTTRFVYRGCDLTGNRCGLWTALAFEPKSWEAGINLLGPVLEFEHAAHPDWSPTADEIVYQRLNNDNWDLWLVNVDGSKNRPLVETANLEGLPSWSPDGQWIAYLAHNGQDWQIRIVNRAGSDDRLLFSYNGGFYAVPIPAEPYGQRDWIDEQISWSE